MDDLIWLMDGRCMVYGVLFWIEERGGEGGREGLGRKNGSLWIVFILLVLN